jgi:hypothetical protein
MNLSRTVASIFAIAFGLAASPQVHGCDSDKVARHDINLTPGAVINSPDGRWQVVVTAATPESASTPVSIRRTTGGKSWPLVSLERSGTVYWSANGHWLVLRDNFAADDTRLEAFDVQGEVPRSVKGIDRAVQSQISALIPKNKMPQWLHISSVCFDGADQSEVEFFVDAPLVPKYGSGSGQAFQLSLSVNLRTRKSGWVEE